MSRRWIDALLLCGSTVVALGIAEIAARALVPVRNAGPDFSEYHPIYGKALRRSISVDRVTPEFTMHLTSNSLGHRGPEPDGPITGGIWFLGDSFTLGYGVDDGQEYPALIRAETERAMGRVPPIVNSGVGNIGSGSWLRRLTEEIDTIQPKLVVLQMSGNDDADNHHERLFTLGPSGELIETPRPVPKTFLTFGHQLVNAIPGAGYSYLVAALKESLARRPPSGAPPAVSTSTTVAGAPEGPSPLAPLTDRIVERALQLCADRHIPVLGLGAELSPSQRARMRVLFERFGAPLVIGPLHKPGSEHHYAIDRHWNARGHARVAELLLAEPRLQSVLAGGPLLAR